MNGMHEDDDDDSAQHMLGGGVGAGGGAGVGATSTPPGLVSQRLQDVATAHTASLAGLTTICAASPPFAFEAALDRNVDASSDDPTAATPSSSSSHHLAQTAKNRSKCPQPPLDDGIRGGGSSIPVESSLVSDVRLDPPERVAPHLVVPESSSVVVADVPQPTVTMTSLAGGATKGSSMAGGDDDDDDVTLDGNALTDATLNAISALSVLCDEVHELENVATNKLLPALMLFGPDPTQVESNNGGGGGAASRATGGGAAVAEMDEKAVQKRESELLKRMGKFLPTLQTVFNFTQRCQRVTKNAVVQIGGCAVPATYGDIVDDSDEDDDDIEEEDALDDEMVEENGADGEKKEDEKESDEEKEDGRQATTTKQRSSKKFKKTKQKVHPAIFGTGVHLLPVGEAIATVLRLLITIDRAVASNLDLQEAWLLYKDVVKDRSVQMQQENNSDPKFDSFERMLVQLDFTLMNSRSFITAIEQNFDPNGLYTTYHHEKSGGRGGDHEGSLRFDLHEELKALLTVLYGRYCSRINTENETTERVDCVGIYGMYCLYRHLLPSNLVPDVKLHKSLWSVLPAMCPVITLHGDLPFLPREFLATYAAYEGVKGCAASPAEIKSEASTLVRKWDTSFPNRAAKLRSEALGWLATADSDLAPSPGTAASTALSAMKNTGADDDAAGGGGGGGGSASFRQHRGRPSVAVEAKTTHLLRGLSIAHSASILLQSQLITHRGLDLTLDPDHVQSLLSLCEVLKSVEKMIRVRRKLAVLSTQRAALKMVASSILKRFGKLRSYVDQYASSLEHSKTPGAARSVARISACLSALEGVLKGSSSFSSARRFAVSIAMCACMDITFADGMSPEDAVASESLLRHLGVLCDIEDHVRRACDCSFLYYHKELVPAFVDELFESGLNSDFGRVQLVLSAVSDPAQELLQQTPHLAPVESSGKSPCYECYKDFVLEALQEGMIGKICGVIEVDLRLAVHSKNLETMKPQNPKQSGTKKLRSFVELLPLSVCGCTKNIKTEVERYLDRTFYNLSTLSVHDCHTYTEMRILARERHGLDLMDNHLPDGSLEQGIDVLHIMSNIHLFVSRYNYNLNEQMFIERRPDRGAKYLNTVSIQSVAASVRQHGLGVVNTAVNYAYKFLSKKFQTFSQFLIDDYMKSLLSKEVRWFNENKDEHGSTYPFSRATSFAQEIRKLGQTDTGKTCLDQCRILLSEIGNTLGFVRMVRSAEKHFCSEELQYIPASLASSEGKERRVHSQSVQVSLDEDGEDVDEDAGPQDDLTRAEKNLGKAIAALSHKSESNYIRVLVNVFKGVIGNSDNAHLVGFFSMVPALCLSWMEASVQGKEMMHKKNITRDGYFFDDGFAMGVAFILTILEQDDLYDALNWFKSLEVKFAADEEDLTEKKAIQEVKKSAKLASAKQTSSWFSHKSSEEKAVDTGEDADDELTILKMMSKRLEGNRKEMVMLYFSMNGARTLFNAGT